MPGMDDDRLPQTTGRPIHVVGGRGGRISGLPGRRGRPGSAGPLRDGRHADPGRHLEPTCLYPSRRGRLPARSGSRRAGRRSSGEPGRAASGRQPDHLGRGGPPAISPAPCVERHGADRFRQSAPHRTVGRRRAADGRRLHPGARPASHVVCRDWPHEVILYRQGDELYCRTRGMPPGRNVRDRRRRLPGQGPDHQEFARGRKGFFAEFGGTGTVNDSVLIASPCDRAAFLTESGGTGSVHEPPGTQSTKSDHPFSVNPEEQNRQATSWELWEDTERPCYNQGADRCKNR